MNRIRQAFFVAAAMCCGVPTSVLAASNDAFDNVLVSRKNGVTTIQIWPACEMQYRSHTPSDAGNELRISVEPSGECAAELGEVTTEMYRRSEFRLGNVSEIAFDRVSGKGDFVSLFFNQPQKFTVRQHPVGWIEIFVDTNVPSASLAENKPAPLRAPSPPPPPVAPIYAAGSMAQSVAPAPARPTRRQVAPSATGNFVVQLGVFASPDVAVEALLQTETEHFAYTTEFNVNGSTWHGLQLGFFDSESSAEIVLQDLRTKFPDSWVRFVAPEEAQLARASGELRTLYSDKVAAVRVTRDAPNSDSEMALLMDDGRDALLARQYDLAIDRYTSVLQHPDHRYRAIARENLAVAFERSGQTANSLAEYQAYLTEFPESDASTRVSERLTSLQTAVPQSRPASESVIGSSSSDWDLFGGFSQYYWRNQEQLVHEGNEIVSSSGVLMLGNVAASRRGERFDILARFNGAYQVNLVEYDDKGNIGWVSDAFVSIIDHNLDVEGRVGRQIRRRDGVLGRFDGIAADYQWKPNVSFSASAGFPIDSPRYTSGSHRTFYAASARVDNIWDSLSVGAYTQQQTVDGISDRQAIGSQLQYRKGRLSAVGLVDFDVSYNVLNSALVNANWLFSNDWQLYGMFNVGAQPYLTTRNALSGQTATTMTELLETYTEGQVRTLARDRTAQASTASIGVSIPIRDRFKLSMDVSVRQSDGTQASGGVAAIPATGAQMFYSGTIVGTDLLRQGDLTTLTTRYDSTRTRDLIRFLFDTRLPFGDGLRINPRLELRKITRKPDNTEQTVIGPSLRVLYRWKKLMLDLEAGGRWSSRELPLDEFDPFTPDGTEQLLGGFVRLGYRLEF